MPSAVAVLECRSADHRVIDEVRLPNGWAWVRLRPDRALAVSVDLHAERVRVAAAIERDHMGLIVVDVSAGWVATTVGEATLAGLTATPIPAPARPWAGAIVGVPAVAVPGPEGWLVLTGASYEAHLAHAIEPEPAPASGRRVEVGR